jgi:hypothetical protein
MFNGSGVFDTSTGVSQIAATSGSARQIQMGMKFSF